MSKPRYVLQVHVGGFSPLYEALSIEASKQTTSADILQCISNKLGLTAQQWNDLELAEVVTNASGQECKERRLSPAECPVALQLLWPQGPHSFDGPRYRFVLKEKIGSNRLVSLSWKPTEPTDTQLIRDYFLRFLCQPSDKEYADLCQLPDLTEQTLLDNLKARFLKGHIYTYVGSILIAVNPFKYYPVYNPKYVGLYQNRRLGDLPPHIFAIADAAYHTMLHERRNQCIVISGESGSGKTESTNFLLHHLTSLSQKGSYGRGVEQTILSAGPVLEAFGNAKTKHNDNSSRFGKFIQVNYRENGMVHGAVVQKYLLEKSRIISQGDKERNYHIFYYLLLGASAEEKAELRLSDPSRYRYLGGSAAGSPGSVSGASGDNEQFEYARLMQSMEMVGFSRDKMSKSTRVLSAVLHLGNLDFSRRSGYHSDESVCVLNRDTLVIISNLLGVRVETLHDALVTKRAKAPGETVVMNHRLSEAVAARDAIAKCLYGALFDWIVMQVNYALLSKKDLAGQHRGYSIGVLDIFGFEDFGNHNTFEQFCINWANEHLQHYFNQHVFNYEQEEYLKEGIHWKNIEFEDNKECLALIEGRPHGLVCLLNDQCNFGGSTDQQLLQKFKDFHGQGRGQSNGFYDEPQKKESAFFVKHYAGKVKYQIHDFKEKNLDQMKPDVVAVLKSSQISFVRELVGGDPVALYRWRVIRAFFKCFAVFVRLRKKYAHKNPTASTGATGQLGRFGRPREGSIPADSLYYDNWTYNSANVNNNNNKGLGGLEYILGASEAKVLQKANQIIQKNKSSRTRIRHARGVYTLQNIKMAHSNTQGELTPSKSSGAKQNFRKSNSTVTSQFGASLAKLMDTLNQANPFFVRCIKSNVGKVPCMFDEAVILQQLRYTGMLETVRIRQSGYSVRLTFEEFIQRYRILLPNGLLSSQSDIQIFLERMKLDTTKYQMGRSKVFLRESEKLKLDEQLHQHILRRIVTLQRLIRAWLLRRHFQHLRTSIVPLQAYCRGYLVRQRVARMRTEQRAAIIIQHAWLRYQRNKAYLQIERVIVNFQAACRGYLARLRYQEYMAAHKFHAIVAYGTLPLEPSKTAVVLPQRRHHPPLRRTSRSMERAPQQGSLGGITPDTVPSRDSLTRNQSHHALPTSPYRTVDTTALHAQTSPLHSSISQLTERIVDNSSANQQPSTHLQQQPQEPHLEDHGRDVLQLRNHQHHERHESSEGHPGFPSSSSPERRPPRSVKKKAPLRPCVSETAIGVGSVRGHGGFRRANVHLLQRVKVHPGQVCASCKGLGYAHMGQCTSCKRLFHSDCSAGSVPCSPVKDSISSFHPTSHSINSLTDRPASQRHSSPLHTSTGESGPGALLRDHRGTSRDRSLFAVHNRHLPVSQQNSTGVSGSPVKSWNLTRTTQFKDPGDVIISDPAVLKNLEAFLLRKLCTLSEGKYTAKDCEVDRVFALALREFKCNLISTYSTAPQDTQQLCLRYKDLTDHYAQVVRSVLKTQTADVKRNFPTTMAVNAFRGFIDEFRNNNCRAPPQEPNKEVKDKSGDKKAKKKAAKKRKDIIEHREHLFHTQLVHITTACEVCNHPIRLMLEKGLICSGCKLMCHKKCYTQISASCRNMIYPHRHHFGVPLEILVEEGEGQVPVVVDMLINQIELRGLYSEGLYRKGGRKAEIDQLRLIMDEDPHSVTLDNYGIHVLSSVLKAFFRDLPEPLMTADLYSNFVWAASIVDRQERLQAIFHQLARLPRRNYELFGRLMFHLARVAQHEDSNRMKSENLAIIFTPCIFRSNNKKEKAQDSLASVAKQTECITLLIEDQLQRLTTTLAEIDTLDTACHTASTRLSSLRSSRMFLAEEKNRAGPEDQFEETILTNHIENLQKEKALLTSDLPTLQPSQSGQGSDDDQLSTTDVDESAAGSLDDLHEREAAAATTVSLGTVSATGGLTTEGSLTTKTSSVTSPPSLAATCSSMDNTGHKLSSKSRVSTPIRRLPHSSSGSPSISVQGSSENLDASDDSTILV
ncbi:unconventional myosin-IXb-like isoform X3 [Varroa jacobsoni]|nr:unconventional myosin-IXb-like isoform X2 [Varroa destructor]XP_022672051.1 unconventional myosin-IXb-like isoform X2 [Varroa destructor]XP_022701062.1 unconventional myosin-IXb-like isoform X3 [Varroa jacobsoni]